MIVVGSFLAIVALAGVHSTVGRWRWLQTRDHSPWLSLSAGTALAYVFVYLLPKLAVTQQKLSALLSQGDWVPILRNQAYLIALLGLVCFFWLGSIDERLTDTRGVDKSALKARLLLNIGGYGVYSLQIGFLIASVREPGFFSLVLATIILGLHLMGVDHGIRKRDPISYDRLLRWVFSAALILGWSLGIATTKLDTVILLWSAFIGGGIIITAIREELPGGQATHFTPFLLGVVGASAAILIVQALQN